MLNKSLQKLKGCEKWGLAKMGGTKINFCAVALSKLAQLGFCAG